MQNTINDRMAVGLAGGLYGVNHDIISKVNYSKKLDKVDITAADTTTTCTVNGVAFTQTTDGSDTKAELAEAVAGLINAGSEPVTAYYTAGNEYFTVESNTPGTTTTVVGTANCTVTAQIGNASAIDFGTFVTQDLMDEEKARVPIVATDITNVLLARGIVCHTQAIEQFYQSAGGAGYALNASMSIVRRGMLWVSVETTVTTQTTPYARFTVATTEKLGAIRGDDDSGKAAIIPTARFERGATAGGLALLDINLP